MTDRLKNISTKTLSHQKYLLRQVTFEYLNSRDIWQTQTREVFDRGHGAAVLLFNKAQRTILLTRQLRIASYFGGNSDGHLLEVCAGTLDEKDPAECARRECEEETGYRIDTVREVLSAYMTPGSVTERLWLFVAAYDISMRVSEGGGLAGEQEDIEVIEMPFDEAVNMMNAGQIKDAKTIILLQYAIIHQLL